MIDFLSGAITVIYLLIGVFFFRFWRGTRDRLFLCFATAFGLFALNQLAATMTDALDERTGFIYILRVLGYCAILFAIIDKNTFSSRKR